MLWALCVEYHAPGQMSPAEVAQWLDDRWRWGTPENPDLVTLEDPSIPPTQQEIDAGRGLLAIAGGGFRVESPEWPNNK